MHKLLYHKAELTQSVVGAWHDVTVSLKLAEGMAVVNSWVIEQLAAKNYQKSGHKSFVARCEPVTVFWTSMYVILI